MQDDDNSAPMLWAMVAEKLEEATALGDRIKVRELEAKLRGTSVVYDELQRDLLLKTCSALKDSFQRLSRRTKDDRFERSCSRFREGRSTCDGAQRASAGISASACAETPMPSQSKMSRLRVPTGTKPLDLFDHRVWTLADPVCFWYGDMCLGDPLRPTPLNIEDFVCMCMRREELQYSTLGEEASNNAYVAPSVNRFRMKEN